MALPVKFSFNLYVDDDSDADATVELVSRLREAALGLPPEKPPEAAAAAERQRCQGADRSPNARAAADNLDTLCRLLVGKPIYYQGTRGEETLPCYGERVEGVGLLLEHSNSHGLTIKVRPLPGGSSPEIWVDPIKVAPALTAQDEARRWEAGGKEVAS